MSYKLKVMKNILIKILFFVSITMMFTSCKKEPIYPTDQLPANVPKLDTALCIGGWGKFVIIDAVMFVDNHETGIKTKYDHFGPNKDTSSLRWDGSLFEIETIIKNVTTYSFWKPINNIGTGRFVLNDDTTKHYCVQYTGLNRSIIEDPNHGTQLLGGSARPFSGQTISYADKTIAIQIQEVEGSINGQNCRYWTQLTLRKIQEW